jgi:hypothetical protein
MSFNFVLNYPEESNAPTYLPVPKIKPPPKGQPRMRDWSKAATHNTGFFTIMKGPDGPEYDLSVQEKIL